MTRFNSSHQQQKKQKKPKWLIFSTLPLLILAMIIPPIFSLQMKLDFRITRDITPIQFSQTLRGATNETQESINSTKYSATFVPSRLSELNFQYTLIQFLYGPMNLLGVPLYLITDPKANEMGFSGEASLALLNPFPVIFSYLVLILILFIIQSSLKDPNELFKFGVSLSLLWLIYSLFIFLLSEPITSPIDALVNRVLGYQDNHINLRSTFGNALNATARLFILSMLYLTILSIALKRKLAAASRPISQQPSTQSTQPNQNAH